MSKATTIEDADSDVSEDGDEHIRKKLKVFDNDLGTETQKKRRVTTMIIRVIEFAKILLFNQVWETRHGAS